MKRSEENTILRGFFFAKEPDQSGSTVGGAKEQAIRHLGKRAGTSVKIPVPKRTGNSLVCQLQPLVIQ
jgi:hypothetical protein